MIRPLFAFGLVVAMAASAETGATAAGIEDATWRVTQVENAEVTFENGPNLTISAGKASGYGGCNSFSASVRIDGETIIFSDIASTRMACKGPGGEIEHRFFAVLANRVSGFRHDGPVLTLIDKAGIPVLVLASP